MKAIAVLLTATALAVSSAAGPHPADAAGCVKGAVVGGVAGHYVGHHGLLGAGIGCAIGHHEANKRARERERWEHQNVNPAGADFR